MEDRTEYTVRVVVEFYVDVSAESDEEAEAAAYDKMLQHLCGWDMPNHTIIAVDDAERLL